MRGRFAASRLQCVFAFVSSIIIGIASPCLVSARTPDVTVERMILNTVGIQGEYRCVCLDNGFERELKFDFSSKYRSSKISGGVVVFF